MTLQTVHPKAYAEGIASFVAGNTMNPYVAGSELAHAWLAGYNFERARALATLPPNVVAIHNRDGKYRVTFDSADESAIVVLVEKAWRPPGGAAWRKLWEPDQVKAMSTGVACAIRAAIDVRLKARSATATQPA